MQELLFSPLYPGGNYIQFGNDSLERSRRGWNCSSYVLSRQTAMSQGLKAQYLVFVQSDWESDPNINTFKRSVTSSRVMSELCSLAREYFYFLPLPYKSSLLMMSLHALVFLNEQLESTIWNKSASDESQLSMCILMLRISLDKM